MNVIPVPEMFVVEAFNAEKLVVLDVTAANNVLVELVKIPFVAKNLVLVAFVVEAYVAARYVLVAFVNVAFVANREARVAPVADRFVVDALVAVRFVKKPFVKFKPEPDIAVDEPFAKITFASVVVANTFNVPVAVTLPAKYELPFTDNSEPGVVVPIPTFPVPNIVTLSTLFVPRLNLLFPTVQTCIPAVVSLVPSPIFEPPALLIET